MVLDDFQEGVPVLWALSSREDKLVLVKIFEALNEKCGDLHPSWFMSDMATQFFGAWDAVFKAKQTKYIWCNWHVDRAWKEGLKRHVTLKSQQISLYHHLKVMMMETNIAKFRHLLSQFLTLSSTVSTAFTTYFQSKYCSRLEQWAMCYRIGAPMNTNMFKESFHRVLKIAIPTTQTKQKGRLPSIYSLQFQEIRLLSNYARKKKGKAHTVYVTSTRGIKRH